MKSNWRWMVAAIGLAYGCRETPPPVQPAAVVKPTGTNHVGLTMGITNHPTPENIRPLVQATSAATTQPATSARSAPGTMAHAVPAKVRRPGDGDQPQFKPTDARPAAPTGIVQSSAPTATPRTANHEIPLTIRDADPTIAPDRSVAISPEVPASPPLRPASPGRSAHVLDLLDAKGHSTQQPSAIALPAVLDGHAPATRPNDTLQVNLPGGPAALSDDPAATVVSLPASANDQRQREQAVERLRRAEADRQAAEKLNDSLLRVLLGSPPPPPPAPATRPTIQLFAP